jgi:hypothetical protein
MHPNRPCVPSTASRAAVAAWSVTETGERPVLSDPDATTLHAHALAVQPGEMVRIHAERDGGAAAVRILLTDGILSLLRTERQDDGGLLITAIRPEHPE